MEQRLSLATLAAADLERSRAFYEALGWTAGFQNDEVVFFQLNGIVLGLYRRDAFAAELGILASDMGPGGQALAHNAREHDEVDRIFAEVEAAGGRVIVSPMERDWGGYSGYFADPDGHRWEVAWNPVWPLDADGDVHMV